MSDVLGSILFFSSNKANATLSLSNVCYSATSFFVTMATLLAKFLRSAKLKLVPVFFVVVVAVVPVLFFGEALLLHVTTNQEGGNNCFKMEERNLICVHHVVEKEPIATGCIHHVKTSYGYDHIVCHWPAK